MNCPICNDRIENGKCVFCGYEVSPNEYTNANTNSVTINECKHGDQHFINECAHEEPHAINQGVNRMTKQDLIAEGYNLKDFNYNSNKTAINSLDKSTIKSINGYPFDPRMINAVCIFLFIIDIIFLIFIPVVSFITSISGLRFKNKWRIPFIITLILSVLLFIFDLRAYF